MICLDSSFLVDYLGGEEYTRAYLDSLPPAEEPPRIPSIVLYELYAGAVRSDTPSRTIQTVVDGLAWGEPLPFDDGSAREAAQIRAELLDLGDPIPVPDLLIAGTARNAGGRIVAVDSHFESVANLVVIDPRE